jgi:PPIC-type PPIASE domain
MSPIRILTVSLLLSGLISAQVKTGATPPPKKGDGIGPVPPPAATGTPDAKQEVPAPPVDTTKLLEQSLKLAKKERAFLDEVVKSGGLLKRFKATRGLADEMTSKFSPGLLGPAMPAKSKARLLGDGEKKTLAEDVIFTVESVPVTKQEYDATLAYLRSYPHGDSVASIETLAIAALIERKAGQGIHPKKAKVARQIMEEIQRRVKKGEKFGALAGQFSEDKSSAKAGGNLGFLARGAMDRGFAMATHELKVSQCSDIAESIDGFHLIRVLGIKKGDSPDQDRIQTAHIVRYYTDDARGRALIRKRIAESKIDVAFRTDEMRALAPAQFR